MKAEGKIENLAQREISRLRADVEHYKAKLAIGPEDSRVFADPYSDAARPLGNSTTVAFYVEEDGARFLVRLDGEHLNVMLSHGNALHVVPAASNVVRIMDGGWPQ